jgi:hypothetical protein
MTQGNAPKTHGLFNVGRDHCERTLPERSIFRLLYKHGDALFADEFFDDLYSWRGRASVPPRIVASVMVLQRLEGLSDREAVERLAFDLRWKLLHASCVQPFGFSRLSAIPGSEFACGGLDADYPSFVHTVLVNMRARLRRSEAPTRIFEAVLGIAKEAGLVGTRRVLDSTPLYDAVATQDTVTLVRSGIRGVLRSCDEQTEPRVRAVLKRDDSYATPGKPVCDWDDADAREVLVDELARDGYAVLTLFDGEELAEDLGQAVRLLATLLGQDLEEGEDGSFRIAKGTSRDRVVSTVDPESRHGRKTASRKYEGYKGHVAIDPDSEIVTATTVTPANVGDGDVVEELIDDLLEDSEDAPSTGASAPSETRPRDSEPPGTAPDSERIIDDEKWPEAPALLMNLVSAAIKWGVGLLPDWFGRGSPEAATPEQAPVALPAPPHEPTRPVVFGDASYGGADVLRKLDEAGIDVYTKVQQMGSRGGVYPQSAFEIDIEGETVTCPAGQTAPLWLSNDGSRRAKFAKRCSGCGLREACTKSKAGRTINVHAEFERLSVHRQAQREPQWQAQYKATRPKVERKLAHMMRRRHGGRRVRVRGRIRVGHDFALLAAAVNLARLATLGATMDNDRWVLQPT